MLYKVLKNVGLSDKEVQVYLTLLKLGTASAVDVAKKSKIPHSTAYVNLKNLVDKGIVYQHERNNTTMFSVEDPESIYTLLEKQYEILNSKKASLIKHLPEIKAISNAFQKRPKVRLFEGKEGIEAIEKEADENRPFTGDTFYSFVGYDVRSHYHSVKKSVDRRIQRGQKLKTIYTHRDGLQYLTNPQELREARFLPRDQFPFNISVVIMPGLGVKIYSFKRNFRGIIIEDADIANSFKALFDFCWQFAQKEPPKR